MSLHSFEPDIAEKVGLSAAVIYQNILYWAEKNKANRKHGMDGLWWTYNSRRAFSEIFPYMTESQIKTAVEKLISSGLIVKGDYNKASYDRTNWYAPAISASWGGFAIGEKSPMDEAEIANGLVRNRQPIPDIKPNTKPDSNARDLFEAEKKTNLPAIIPQPAPDHFAEFWAAYPKSPRKTDRPKAMQLFARITAGKHPAIAKADPAALIAAVKRYAATGPDPQFVPLPTTWLNGERWTQFAEAGAEEDPEVAAARARLQAITANAMNAARPRQ